MQKITVIGLGGMGSALARTLLDSGYDVTVWNRTASKASALVAAGAALATTTAEAIEASPTIVTCIGSHGDTRQLLEENASVLAGKKIIELSTGPSGEAKALDACVKSHGAECLIGMILSYPSGIGNDDIAILVAGPESLWQQCEGTIKTLAGNSSHIGENVSSVAVLFAAMFLPRQGLMMGMIFGSLLSEKAGIPVQTYVDQLPQLMKPASDYMKVVTDTIPSNDFTNPGASVNVYAAAYKDMIGSFHEFGANAEMPELMYRFIDQGIDAGYGDEQLTSLIKLFR